jgi:hypothetical protein
MRKTSCTAEKPGPSKMRSSSAFMPSEISSSRGK